MTVLLLTSLFLNKFKDIQSNVKLESEKNQSIVQNSEENLQKVRAMGDNWWNRFGEKSMKLLLEK